MIEFVIITLLLTILILVIFIGYKMLFQENNNTEETENTIEIYRWKDYWW